MAQSCRPACDALVAYPINANTMYEPLAIWVALARTGSQGARVGSPRLAQAHIGSQWLGLVHLCPHWLAKACRESRSLAPLRSGSRLLASARVGSRLRLAMTRDGSHRLGCYSTLRPYSGVYKEVSFWPSCAVGLVVDHKVQVREEASAGLATVYTVAHHPPRQKFIGC